VRWRTPDDLVGFVQSKKPGSEVVVALVRDGKKHKMTVLPGEGPPRNPRIRGIELPDSSRFLWRSCRLSGISSCKLTAVTSGRSTCWTWTKTWADT